MGVKAVQLSVPDITGMMHDFCCSYTFFFFNFFVLYSIVVTVYACSLHKSDCAFLRGYVRRDDNDDHDNIYLFPSHIRTIVLLLVVSFYLFLFRITTSITTNTARWLYIKNQMQLLVLSSSAFETSWSKNIMDTTMTKGQGHSLLSWSSISKSWRKGKKILPIFGCLWEEIQLFW